MIQALTLLSFLPLLVSGINVPYTHSLAKRTHRIQVPRTLQEGGGVLVARQGTCDPGLTACSNGGCCDGSCCGDGCCPSTFYCDPVGNTPACCPNGETCSDTISGCTDITLVECVGYDFCCPAGQACSLDGNGNAQCNGVTIGNGNGTGSGNGNGNGNGNNNPVTTTSTPIIAPPPLTSSTPQFSQINTNFNNLPTTTTTRTPTIPTTTSSTKSASNPTNNGSTGGGGRVGVANGLVGIVLGLMGMTML